MENLVTIEGISFLSEDYSILKDISLSVPKGQCTIIMGSSGCGKSTLLKIIAGIYPPDSGRVMIENKDMLLLSDKELKEFRKKSGFMFQDSALWENTNISENISLPVKFHFSELTGEEINNRIKTMVTKIGFLDSIQLRPAMLSSGEKKVISFIRAIINDPDILFLDDPTEGMDNMYSRKLIQILKEKKEKQSTIVAVSHNTNLVSLLADYLIILKKGTVIEYGEFNTIKQSNNTYVKEILSKVLGEAASYDTELLDLLNE
ncbi:MAG: ATP-binding cassette domain-containing protein [Spirochaetales bacterium]|nr:ATP-binding cassette domain-containing protein [Spirochaetales bacterium]